MSYQRVEASNDKEFQTWLVREEFNNIRKANNFFKTLCDGKNYKFVNIEKYDDQDNHIGTVTWMAK